MAEPSVISLILDMKKMYIDGATNSQLCSRATEIHDRLEIDRALAKGDAKKLAIVDVEQRALERIVAQIRKGRDDPRRKESAMKGYDDYLKSRKKKEKK